MGLRTFFGIYCALSLAIVSAASDPAKLAILKLPAPGTQTLDGAFQGYSMEMASFRDLAGNLTTPNKLSIRVLQDLEDLNGSAAPIRVEGTTANLATYVPTQREAIIANYAVGTQYTVGLTFDLGAAGEEKTSQAGSAIYKSLGGDLYAFEIGNEFGAFPLGRNANYTIRQYVPEWLTRAAAVAQNVFGGRKEKRRFRAGVFTTPGSYFGATCAPVKPTLARDLMNRTAFFGLMKYHETSSAYSVSKGIPYVIGETNSIACQGLAGVSDVFGAALWSIDYALHAASLNVSKIFWHMGTGYRYAAWQGVQNGTTAAGPRPLYYGNLLVNTALGGPDKQVVSIANTTTIGGYAIYAAPQGRHSAKLEGIVLVNLEVFNSRANPQGARPSAIFELPSYLIKGSKALSVRRLTAADAEVKEGIEFAGRTVALDGRIGGRERVKTIKKTTISVKANEAVLISFK